MQTPYANVFNQPLSASPDGNLSDSWDKIGTSLATVIPVTDIPFPVCDTKSPAVRAEVAPMALALVEEIPVGKKRGVTTLFEYGLTTEEPEVFESGGALHTESCPKGCCDVRIVTRYLLKSA